MIESYEKERKEEFQTPNDLIIEGGNFSMGGVGMGSMVRFHEY